MSYHITPGRNGWTDNACRIAKAISHKADVARAEREAPANEKRREQTEWQYYEDNHCYPHPTGYFGTETDAHFYER